MSAADPSVAPAALARPPAHPRRIAYFGTPAMAVPALRALHDAGFEVAVVVTRADKRRGRRGMAEPSPVKAAAAELAIPVVHAAEDALGFDVDLGVVVAFGEVLRRPLLERLAMVNLHFSLLPRWRGAAPVERAILAGDEQTGVCVMAVEEGLDTGGVYARSVIEIAPTATAAALSSELTSIGSELLVRTLRAGLGDPEPQVGDTTYASKLTADDRRIEWGAPARAIDRVVRVGGAWTTFRGKRLKVLAADLVDAPGAGAPGAPGELVGDVVVAGEGGLRLVRVQPEGKGPVGAADWRNGARPLPGERLGSGEVIA